MMPEPRSKARIHLKQPPPGHVSPLDSARYTADMLESLRRIALAQGHTVLAHLLELTQAEARLVVRDGSRATP